MHADGRGRRGTEPGEPIRDGGRRADPTVRCLAPSGEQDDADHQGSDEHAPRHQHEAVDVHPAITDCPSPHADREPPRQADRHGDGYRGGADRHRQRPDQIGHHELAATDSQRPEEAPVRALRAKLPGHGQREEERRHDGDRERERQQGPSLRADLTVHRSAHLGRDADLVLGGHDERSLTEAIANGGGEVLERRSSVRGSPP